MQYLSISGLKIKSVYGCLPQQRVDNRETLLEMYGERVDSIVKATGILQRYIANPGTSSLDLCVRAAEQMMCDMEYDRSSVGALVSVSFTPHQLMPSNASLAQHRLGLPKHIVAMDINFACSGYAYGLWLAGTLAQSLGKPVILLDGDVQSAFLSPYDSATVPVLADAGSATLIEPMGDDVWTFAFYTDGSRSDYLRIPAGGSAYIANEAAWEYHQFDDIGQRRDRDIAMDGFAIFKFVAQDVSQMLVQFLKDQGSTASDFGAFIPHQANMYMVRQLGKRVGFSSDKLWQSGDVFGNSASATVPMTIALRAAEALEHQSERVLLSGFGAGLSLSIADMYLGKHAVYRIIDY